MGEFKWRHFEGEIILWAVRWYCRYGISYRDLEQMMGERGVPVDHSTIYRWVQKYAPEIEKRLRWQWRRPQSTSWRVDETYVKVRGKWAYLYRALDKHGNTIDFYLSPTRNARAAKRFLGKALHGLKAWEKPEVINTDKAPTYGIAISELKAEGKCPEEAVHRQVKYLNNVIEADHGKLKQLIRPVRGFKTLKTAYATIMGFEVMRALRKGQAAIFNLTRDIHGEVRIVERAFGLGASALTETIALIEETLNLQPALRLGNERFGSNPSKPEVCNRAVQSDTALFKGLSSSVDVILDMVGAGILERCLDALKQGGRVVSVATAGPQPQKPNLQITFFYADVTAGRLQHLNMLLESGKITARVGSVLPLEDARAAHRMLAGAHHKPGKIILQTDFKGTYAPHRQEVRLFAAPTGSAKMGPRTDLQNTESHARPYRCETP